ncbi:MerR family transcriptional regulator [Thalassorhabdus alkalitolerans]|uniref:MerR family transcriptional regulator n=1 Tax=Thalassorhabdus alkalitolerans TaxID=2282697 RepID=A0ABW0YTV2_9BACI
MSQNETGKYNIKAISKMLGIQPGTLRAWERRYHIIEPVRNQAGHRLYTEEHVGTLRWLIDKVEKGFTIGQAVDLFEKEDFQLDSVEGKGNGQVEEFSIKIREALLSFNESEAQALADRAFSIFSIEKVLIEIFTPLLIKVGDLWERNSITAAHEHFASNFIKMKMGNIFQSYRVDAYLPKVLVVCAPDERHELGLLTFTFFLRRKGFDVIYLGTGVPGRDILTVVNQVQPKLFFISCTMVKNLEGALQVVKAVAKKHPNTVTGIGGSAVKGASTNELGNNLLIMDSTIQGWDHWFHDFFQQYRR